MGFTVKSLQHSCLSALKSVAGPFGLRQHVRLLVESESPLGLHLLSTSNWPSDVPLDQNK